MLRLKIFLARTRRSTAAALAAASGIALAAAGCESAPNGPEAAEPPTPACTIADHDLRGWNAVRLDNGLVALEIVPAIGGRVIQYTLGDHGFFWVNPQLAGKAPTESGLAPDGGWLNYGGDKLWPAPQGWDGDDQWPGPPDAVLDGQPYTLERLAGGPGEAAIRLTSRDDPLSGIRFSRIIRVRRGTTRVDIEATMRNVDVKPRRWGIWAHTQLDAREGNGPAYNLGMVGWCPLNPLSRHRGGYRVIFGKPDNPSFQPDRAHGLMRVQYRYQVGKVGLDSHAGWVATVDQTTGDAFVQGFIFEPEREYPDGASVEFWLSGRGRIHAYRRDIDLPDDPEANPCIFESEVISPFALLEPGEEYTWRYAWCATNIGKHRPVTGCVGEALISEPLEAWAAGDSVRLRGRFGLFRGGAVRVDFRDRRGRTLGSWDVAPDASPRAPVILNAQVARPAGAAIAALVLCGPEEREILRTEISE